MKKTFPLMLVVIFGVLGIIPFLIPHPVIQNTDQFVRNDFLKILYAFALVLGLGSLLKVHSDRIRRKREIFGMGFWAWFGKTCNETVRDT